MELHKALRNIINTEGQEILNDLRLVNILDDFNAYQDIPASKYILRAIIADGFTSKLLPLGKWDCAAELLVNKFITVTGFVPEAVNRIFLSLAYGLEWLDEKTIKTHNDSSVSNNHKSQSPQPKSTSTPVAWNKKMTDDEKERYVFSLLEYDNSKESKFHVKLENLSFDIDEDEEITIQCEFRRTGKVPGTGYAWLHYALYDQRGRMKDTGLVSCVTNTESNPKPVSNSWWKLKVPQISKIRLYWEA